MYIDTAEPRPPQDRGGQYQPVGEHDGGIGIQREEGRLNFGVFQVGWTFYVDMVPHREILHR